MDDDTLRVLTLNCWGLKYVSKHRRERIAAIAAELATLECDIVGLQELWVSSDYELVRLRVSDRLPYSKVFYSGALGSGLAIFSRFPISAASLHRYSLNGSPADVIAGDWFVGKAAVSILISHPILGDLEVFNTHLYAKGGEDGPEHNRAHRLVNSWEFAKLARTSAEMGRYVIATGDFNSVPDTLPMNVIKEHAALSDAWEASHPRTHDSELSPSPADAIDLFGVTADSPLNSYSAGKPLEAHALRHQGKRLDYVLYRGPDIQYPSRYHLVCSQSKVVFTSKVPGQNFSYSDHFGLQVTLAIQKTGSLSDSHETCDTLHDSSAVSSLTDSTVASALQAFGACYRMSRSRSQLQLATFAGCIAILVMFVVGSAWFPPWTNPLLIALTVFLSWLGTTMLYIGFLFGNWELRALVNVIEEVELLKNKRNREGGQ